MEITSGEVDEYSAFKEKLIAIVDDDDLARSSLLRLLRSWGCRAEAFPSAEDFLASVPAAETACLLLDLRMPGMGGFELERHLNENGPAIPIIILSAHASENEELRALRAGAISFLRKPVSKDALQLALRKALQADPN